MSDPAFERDLVTSLRRIELLLEGIQLELRSGRENDLNARYGKATETDSLPSTTPATLPAHSSNPGGIPIAQSVPAVLSQAKTRQRMASRQEYHFARITHPSFQLPAAYREVQAHFAMAGSIDKLATRLDKFEFRHYFLSHLWVTPDAQGELRFHPPANEIGRAHV